MAKPRLRDLGINIGVLPTGRYNAITDVAGVRVRAEASLRPMYDPKGERVRG